MTTTIATNGERFFFSCGKRISRQMALELANKKRSDDRNDFSFQIEIASTYSYTSENHTYELQLDIVEGRGFTVRFVDAQGFFNEIFTFDNEAEAKALVTKIEDAFIAGDLGIKINADGSTSKIDNHTDVGDDAEQAQADNNTYSEEEYKMTRKTIRGKGYSIDPVITEDSPCYKNHIDIFHRDGNDFSISARIECKSLVTAYHRFRKIMERIASEQPEFKDWGAEAWFPAKTISLDEHGWYGNENEDPIFKSSEGSPSCELCLVCDINYGWEGVDDTYYFYGIFTNWQFPTCTVPEVFVEADVNDYVVAPDAQATAIDAEQILADSNNDSAEKSTMFITAKTNAKGNFTSYYLNGEKIRKDNIWFYACNPAFNGVIVVDYDIAKHSLNFLFDCPNPIIFKNRLGLHDVTNQFTAKVLGLELGKKISINPDLFIICGSEWERPFDYSDEPKFEVGKTYFVNIDKQPCTLEVKSRTECMLSGIILGNLRKLHIISTDIGEYVKVPGNTDDAMIWASNEIKLIAIETDGSEDDSDNDNIFDLIPNVSELNDVDDTPAKLDETPPVAYSREIARPSDKFPFRHFRIGDPYDGDVITFDDDNWTSIYSEKYGAILRRGTLGGFYIIRNQIDDNGIIFDSTEDLVSENDFWDIMVICGFCSRYSTPSDIILNDYLTECIDDAFGELEQCTDPVRREDFIKKIADLLIDLRNVNPKLYNNFVADLAEQIADDEPQDTLSSVAETCAELNANAPSGWEIRFDSDHNQFPVEFNGLSVAKLDSLATLNFLSPHDFFNQFRPLIDKNYTARQQFIDDRQREIDELLIMRDELGNDTERLKTLDDMIAQLQRDIFTAEIAE